MPPEACPCQVSSHSTWSLMSKLALSEVERHAPRLNSCHHDGSVLPAAAMCRYTWMPLNWSMPAGGENEPTSISAPVIWLHAKFRLAVPSHDPQRSATPEACAGSARKRDSRA